MCVIVFVSATIFNVQISPTFCERMYVCACVNACVRAVCFVFKYFCFLGCFFVLCFMPPNFEDIEGAYWFGPVRASVCLSVRLSICLDAHPQFGRQKDRQLHRQRGKSIDRAALAGERKLQIFVFFLSFCACMQSVCLPAWRYTHMIVRMHARAHTYQPTDRQTNRKSDCQTVWQTDPTRMYYEKKKKEVVFFTG